MQSSRPPRAQGERQTIPQLRADISRLAAGMVSIRNAKAKIEFIGHLSSPEPRSTKSAVIGFTGSILS